MEVPKAVPATECYVCNEHWAPRLSSMEHQQLKLLLLRGYLPIRIMETTLLLKVLYICWAPLGQVPGQVLDCRIKGVGSEA